jgi:hypothetical protein
MDDLRKKYPSTGYYQKVLVEVLRYYIAENGQNVNTMTAFLIFLPVELLESELVNKNLSMDIYANDPIHFGFIFTYYIRHHIGTASVRPLPKSELRLELILKLTMKFINNTNLFSEYIFTTIFKYHHFSYEFYQKFLPIFTRENKKAIGVIFSILAEQFAASMFYSGSFPGAKNPMVVIMSMMDRDALKTYLSGVFEYQVRGLFKDIGIIKYNPVRYPNALVENKEMYNFLCDLLGKELIDKTISDQLLRIAESFTKYRHYFDL